MDEQLHNLDTGPAEAPEELPPVTPIEQLPASLGFVETQEIIEARSALVQAMISRDWQAIKELMAQYHALGGAVVEQHQGDEYTRAKIGLILATGLAWREAGKLDSYGAELYNAHLYAGNMEYDDIVASIEAAMVEANREFARAINSDYEGPPTDEILASCIQELPPELHEELSLMSKMPPKEVLESVATLMAGQGIEETAASFFARMGWIIE